MSDPADKETQRHGGSQLAVDLAVWLGPDPELALVTADPHAWMEAHPCECEALCECEEEA